MAAITYAKAGVTPPFWMHLQVIDLDTGEELSRVCEVNTVEGWLVREKVNERGEIYLDGDEIARERVEGRFELRRRAA